MSSELNEGAIFASRYQVVRRIAAGAMGAVYEVIHLETARRRALKVMLPHIVENEELRERFKLEARAAARIESDFIVDVFDAGVDEATGMPFLVMELLRGEELGKRLKRVKRFEPAEALTYLRHTALALDKTHRASIIHRDLKPGNLFLTEQDDGTSRVKVLDFGIAKLISEGTTSTNATAAIGTPLYMAPEQFRNGKISPATDIYALGIIAYTFLVGEGYWAPEMRENNPISFMLIASGCPQQPASVRAAAKGIVLPPGFDAWFAQMTALAPAARFPTVMAAVTAFSEMLGMPPLRSTSMPSIRESDPARSTFEPPAGLSTGTGKAMTRELTSGRSKARAILLPVVVGGVLVLGGILYMVTGKFAATGKSETVIPVAAANEPVAAQTPSAGSSAASPDASGGAPAASAIIASPSAAPTATITTSSDTRKPQLPPAGKAKVPAPKASANLGLRQTL
jgi:eukaryotic-like serine/threonine-protein kinase